MMLEHLGELEAAKRVMLAIESVLTAAQPRLTPDLGGAATTVELGTAIAAAV
jgi:tartrate dehydrogenase/decarboxylase/D-malate dehydrogenase